jgi:hypothetical protein
MTALQGPGVHASPEGKAETCMEARQDRQPGRVVAFLPPEKGTMTGSLRASLHPAPAQTVLEDCLGKHFNRKQTVFKNVPQPILFSCLRRKRVLFCQKSFMVSQDTRH